MHIKDKMFINYYLIKYKTSLYSLSFNQKFVNLFIHNIKDKYLKEICYAPVYLEKFISNIKEDSDKLEFLSNKVIENYLFSIEKYSLNITFKAHDYYLKLLNLYSEKVLFHLNGDGIHFLLSNNLVNISKDKLYELILNIDFSDNVYEYFIPMYEDVRKSIILNKIKSPKVKVKYFDYLDISVQKDLVSFLSEEEKIKYIDASYLMLYVLPLIKNFDLLLQKYMTLDFNEKKQVLFLMKNEDYLIKLISFSNFNNAQLLDVTNFLCSNVDDRMCISKETLLKISKMFHNVVIENVIESSNKKENYNALYLPVKFNTNFTFGIELEAAYDYNYILINLKNFNNDAWNIKNESSVDNGVEFSSKIFHYDQKSLNEIKNMCDFLSNNDFKYTEDCGGHIHVGFNAFSNVEELTTFFKIYCNFEKIIFYMLNRPNSVVRKSIETYAIPFSKKLDYELNRFHYPTFSSINNFLSFLCRSGCKRTSAVNTINVYHGLKNTIEFRLPNGEFNYEYLHENIIFILSLIEFSKNNSKNKFIKDLINHSCDDDYKAELLLKLLFKDNEYLYNIYMYRYKQNKEANKDNFYLENNTLKRNL